jgi:hypothetical protein
MRSFSSSWGVQRPQFTAVLAAVGLFWIPIPAGAQTPARAQGASPTAAAQSQDQDLQKQLAELRAQLAKLQTALEQQTPPAQAAPAPADSPQASGRRMMGEMGAKAAGGMPMGDAAEMAGMSSGGTMGMMDMHKGEMGMPPEGMKMPEGMMMAEMGMGRMPGGSGAAMSGGTASGGSKTAGGGMAMGGGGAATAPSGTRAPRSVSALPGVPGASHLYHVGSTGFFLDQPQIQLTSEQQAALNRIKERALLARSNAERGIEQAEQEVWALTGADQPDAAKLQTKLQEVERLRTNERLAFIREVGEATKVLTSEQRNVLLGTASPKK